MNGAVFAGGDGGSDEQALRRLALATAVAVVGAAWSATRPIRRRACGSATRSRFRATNAQGAAITTLTGYKLWVDDVNKKGGLKVQGFDKRIPIEVTDYDDTSNAENAVRLTERLMTQDKVDFVLPPWSTGFNLATAPVFAAQRLSAACGDGQFQ